MKKASFALLTITLGASGIVSQALLARELMADFYGNELTLGVIFACWVLAQAIGALIAGLKSGSRTFTRNIFFFLGMVCLFSLVFGLCFARLYRNHFNFPFAEGTSLFSIFTVTIVSVFLAGFSNGGLAAVLSGMYIPVFKDVRQAISKVYLWTTIGSILGGWLLTFVLLGRFTVFSIAWLISVVNLFALCQFILVVAKRKALASLVIIVSLGISVYSYGLFNKLDHLTLRLKYQGKTVIEHRESPYGSIILTKDRGQYTFFYNGLPFITVPRPDTAGVEDFAHSPFLFYRAPPRVLVISGGLGGLLFELLKHPLVSLDYVEMDKVLVDLVEKYPTDITRKELSDPRVRLVNADGRLFLKNAPAAYDLIYLGVTAPSDLRSNRFFTREFFTLVKSKLSSEGIFTFNIYGSSVYLSRELKNLNACILNSLKPVFRYNRVIPGEPNIILSSDSDSIISQDAIFLAGAFIRGGIQTETLTPDYLGYRLNVARQEWFNQSLKGLGSARNSDFKPLAVYEMLLYWNERFNPASAKFWQSLRKIDLQTCVLFLFSVTAIFLTFFRKSKYKSRIALAYSVFSTGFFGMFMTIILLFGFQVAFGYLYGMIGLLLGSFMAGISLGAMITANRSAWINSHKKLFVSLEMIMGLFSLILAIFLPQAVKYNYCPAYVFMLLLIFSGLLVGGEFPLAAAIFGFTESSARRTAGLIYALDLAGGCLAGILTGIVFFPLLGLADTCLLVAALKLSSAGIFVSFNQSVKLKAQS